MASITWSNTTPGDDSTASAVDDQIRADLSAMSTGLQEAMYWLDGSANSDGEYKPGTLRFGGIGSSANPRNNTRGDGYVAIHGATRVSDGVTAPTGYQFGGLYEAGTGGLLGHPAMVERYPLPTTKTSRWVIATGTIEMPVSATQLMTSVITFGPTYSHGSAVRVFATVQPSPTCNAGYAVNDIFTSGIDYVSAVTCQSSVSWVAPGVGPSPGATVTVQWLSEGTVAY